MLECCFYSPQWADLLQRRFSLNRLACCQTLAEVTAIGDGNYRYECENMPHSFSNGKHLNLISKLGEHCWKLSKKMSEHSNIKCGGGCVALLKFKFKFYTGPGVACRCICSGWTLKLHVFSVNQPQTLQCVSVVGCILISSNKSWNKKYNVLF